MLCLSGFELYSRWVPLKFFFIHISHVPFFKPLVRSKRFQSYDVFLCLSSDHELVIEY